MPLAYLISKLHERIPLSEEQFHRWTSHQTSDVGDHSQMTHYPLV